MYFDNFQSREAHGRGCEVCGGQVVNFDSRGAHGGGENITFDNFVLFILLVLALRRAV